MLGGLRDWIRMQTPLQDWFRLQVAKAVQSEFIVLKSFLDGIDRRLDQLRAELAADSIGTILVLWNEPDGTPRCASRTIRLAHGAGTTVEHEESFRFNWPIPAGAWVVAHGCAFRSVHNGMLAEDLGPAPRGKLVCLREGVSLGRLLSVVVVSER